MAITGVGAPYVYFPAIKSRRRVKERSRWLIWESIAKALGLGYHMPSNEPWTPTIYGTFREHSVSIQPLIQRVGNSEYGEEFVQIKIPVSNPRRYHFLLRDENMKESVESFFLNRIYGICKDEKLEKRFVIKGSSEVFCAGLLNTKEIQESLHRLKDVSIEIYGQNLCLQVKGGHADSRYFLFLLELTAKFADFFESSQAKKNREAA